MYSITSATLSEHIRKASSFKQHCSNSTVLIFSVPSYLTHTQFGLNLGHTVQLSYTINVPYFINVRYDCDSIKRK